jgi:hypothetical protein
MSGPEALTLNTYTGFLRLDDERQVSRLEWRLANGTMNSIVMMLDPSPSGAYDPVEVIEAWQYFSNKPGVYDGTIITVVGFIAVPPGASEAFLAIVRG